MTATGAKKRKRSLKLLEIKCKTVRSLLMPRINSLGWSIRHQHGLCIVAVVFYSMVLILDLHQRQRLGVIWWKRATTIGRCLGGKQMPTQGPGCMVIAGMWILWGKPRTFIKRWKPQRMALTSNWIMLWKCSCRRSCPPAGAAANPGRPGSCRSCSSACSHPGCCYAASAAQLRRGPPSCRCCTPATSPTTTTSCHCSCRWQPSSTSSGWCCYPVFAGFINY